MKSISHGTVSSPHEVGHEEDRALEDADEEEVAARVVGGDLGAELADPRLDRLCLDQDLPDGLLQLCLRHSPESFHARTASSQPGAARIPGTATTSSPARRAATLSLATGDLRIDEHVLNLLRSGPPGDPRVGASRTTSPGRSALEPPRRRAARPGPRAAPGRIRARRGGRRGGRRSWCRPSTREVAQRALELARQRPALLGEGEQVARPRRVQPTQEGQDLVTDEPALRPGIRRVHPVVEAVLVAVRARCPRARRRGAA